MVNPALVESRLTALGLAAPSIPTPGSVLQQLGPMQGQEFDGVTSSIALRVAATQPVESVNAVRHAYDLGSVVRGYPMRSTVFALAAQDAAWITELCSPVQRRQSRRRLLQLGVTEDDLARAQEVLNSHPTGLTREELLALWTESTSRSGSDSARSVPGPYLLVRDMMLHGTAVYGPTTSTATSGMRTEVGSGQLVVPAVTWLPAGTDLEGRFNGDTTAATAELLLRYLHGHGPAGIRDFAWWTKLPVTLITSALSTIRDQLERVSSFDSSLGEEAWCRPGLIDDVLALKKQAHGTFLLPAFDELMLGYRDRLAFLTDDHHAVVAPGNNGAFRKTIVRAGKFIGTWAAPKASSGDRRIKVSAFSQLSAAAHRDISRSFLTYPHS